MKQLTNEHKRFIVCRLAAFVRPVDVQRELRERYALEVSLNRLCLYDPTKPQGKELSRELTTLFQKTRDKYLAEEEAIPITHRAYRMRRLQEIIDDPLHSRNPQMVCDVLKQAAQEMGGLFERQARGSGAAGERGARVVTLRVDGSIVEEASNELEVWRKQMRQSLEEMQPPALTTEQKSEPDRRSE